MRRSSVQWILLTLFVVTAFLSSFTLICTTAGRTAMAYAPPVSSFTFSPTTPMPYDLIVFDASGSYAQTGYIVQYKWDFGDGSVVSTTNTVATHSYPVDGTYTVELTVIDNNSFSDSSSAVVQVSSLVFFRPVLMGTLAPIANVRVTAYRYNGSAWAPAPVGSNELEIRYDNMTQPNLASTDAEKYRNPGFTASILLENASNIGFDIHQSDWNVYFKFEWGPYTAYWPNETTRVYSYQNGAVETHDYGVGHKAYWDSTAGTYVIKVSHIRMDGVDPIACHPIIVGILCPPTQQYYLTTKTDPLGIATIPGEGWYNRNTNVTLTAPSTIWVSTTSQYRFNYWDVDGISRGAGVNPIVVQMNTNHTSTAHYKLQYLITFEQSGLSPDATGTVVTIDGTTKVFGDLPFSKFVDDGASVAYSYNSIIASSVAGQRYRLNTVTGPTSPITVSGPSTVTGNYITQYSVIFTQTGLDSSSTGTVVTVNSVAKVYGDLPYTVWVDNCGSVTYSFSSPVSSSVAGKRFKLNTVSGPSSPIVVTGSLTVTGNYIIQYQITFAASGLDVTASSVIIVNGTIKTYSDLPYSVWIDSGLSLTYSYNNIVSSSMSGKRFKLNGVTGPSSPIPVTTTFTVTGNYLTQYKVIFDQTGVGSDFAGTIVTVDSVNYNLGGLPASFWWDKNTSHNYSFLSPLTVNGTQEYAWSSTSGLSNLQSGILTITSSGTVVGNYITQNTVIFDQIGVSSDYSGTVVTIDGAPYTMADLPRAFSWQLGTTHSFSFQSPLVVTANGKQYAWTSTSGLSSLQNGSITLTTFGSIVGNYRTQYYLAVSSPFGTTTGQGWYNDGATAYASLNTGTADHGNGTRHVFTNWNVDASGTDYAHSNPITMNQAKNAVASWTAQLQITFDQTGVGSDFDGTIVSIDGNGYTRNQLPASFWWNIGSTHTFSFASPLSPGISKQYLWTGTTGLSSLQTDTLLITASGSIIGNYTVQYKFQIIFDQTGINTDFTGEFLTVDGTDYALIDLPISFWWNSGTIHSYSYSSPLLVETNVKQYMWTSTSGLSTAQSGALTVTTSGSVTGNYKTQYYLTLATNPVGIASPSGDGWFDAGASATVSTPAFIDITPGSSRYRFNGWTTPDMTEISNPSNSPTSVLIDKAKTVTANYVLQYKITFGQSGAYELPHPDPILQVDGVNYHIGILPASFWYDNGSTHTFSYVTSLVVVANKKAYVWTSTTGLSTASSETITVSSSGSITGNYKTQYYLSVTSPYGSPSPTSGWYDSGTTIPASVNSPVSGPAGARYVCTGWNGTGSVPTSGSGTMTTFQITAGSSILWTWKTQYYLTVSVDPAGLVVIPGEGWYDTSAVVSLNAPAVANFTFVNWDIDGTSAGNGVNPVTPTMSMAHTATAHYRQISVETLTVSIDPLARTMTLGTSVTFTSTIQGGKLPYGYQWYLNGQPVPGATSSTWTFTPTTGGIYYVYLKVTDADHTIAQSQTARIDVIPNPVGGYSTSLKTLPAASISAYFALVSLFGAALSLTKRKKK